MNRRGPDVVGLSWQTFSLGLVIVIWAIVRILQLDLLGWGTGYDVNLYLQYGQQFGRGAAAYVEYQPEYPPGALPIFFLPLPFAGPTGYPRAFAAEMAAFDFAACLLVLRCAELRADSSWYRPLLIALLYILVTAALFPVLYTRFDLVPGTLVLGALYCLHTRRTRSSALLLGAAGAVKLWPFALVPIWLAWEMRRGGFRRLVTTGLWVLGGAVLIALPTLPRAGWAILSFLRFHAERGIQIETTWATLAMLLKELGIAAAQPEHNYGAFHVEGPVPRMFATLSLPLIVLFALLPQLILIVRGFRHGKNLERLLDSAVLAGVLGFMIAGKVLSPQFMLWIAPLLPLVVQGPAGWLSALVMALLTTLVYPYLSPALEQRAEGHGYALVAVAMRNVLLISWYWLAVYRASGGFRSKLAEQGLAAQLPNDRNRL